MADAQDVPPDTTDAYLALTETLDLDLVLERLLEHLGRRVPFDSATVMFLEDPGTLTILAAHGFGDQQNTDAVRGVRFNIEARSHLEQLLSTKASVLIHDAHQHPGWERRPGSDHIRSWMGVPLVLRGTAIGLYSLDHTQPGFYTSEHVARAEALAPHAAVAIDHARLFREREESAAHLRHTLSLLTATLESTADGILVVDLEGRIVRFNRRCSALLGIPDTALATLSATASLDLFVKQLADPDAFLDGVHEMHEHPEQERFDVLHFKDGRTFERHSLPQLVGDEIVGRVLSFRDVTERRKATEALAASERRFRSVAQSAIDGIVSANASGDITFWNRAAEEMFGFSADEALGQPLTMIMPERYRDPHRRSLARFVSTGEGRVMGKAVELVGLRRDGKEFPVELALGFWESGGERMLSGIVRDVTARKALEEQFRQAQKMEAVGQLAGGIAHDFNNLLTAIMGYCELIRLGLPPDAPVADDVAQIAKAGTAAASLTRQLLAFSRRQILQPVVLDLNTVVTETLDLLKRVIGEDVSVVMRLAPGLGSVRADHTQMQQVLMNLSVNARDAMPDGGTLTIETANVTSVHGQADAPRGLEPGRYVVVKVTDTGMGMTSEVQQHIFEPFFTTKGPGKGTGLGLATVYGTVKQSGGNLSVESAPGRGSTFTIHLPRVAGAAAQEVAEREVPASTAEATILVVEDTEQVRTFVCRSLQRFGFVVVSASGVDDIVEMCASREGPVDLVLTDVVMADGGGREVVELVRSRWPQVKILYMTGYTPDAVAEHGIADSGIALIQKPFSPQTIALKIREVLGAP